MFHLRLFPTPSRDAALLRQAAIDADFISVAYNPGRAVRVNSAMLAAAIKQQVDKEVSFTLATRDMNKVALQSQLLGAQLLGLENVIVVQGDPFTPRDLERVKAAADVTPTGLIAAITGMNQGLDFRESQLRAPTDFCVGATVDLGRGIQKEAGLAVRKARAGAQFSSPNRSSTWPTLPTSRTPTARHREMPYAFRCSLGCRSWRPTGSSSALYPRKYRTNSRGAAPAWKLPWSCTRSSRKAALHNIYLVPPIRRGGARNYGAARELLGAVGR